MKLYQLHSCFVVMLPPPLPREMLYWLFNERERWKKKWNKTTQQQQQENREGERKERRGERLRARGTSKWEKRESDFLIVYPYGPHALFTNINITAILEFHLHILPSFSKKCKYGSFLEKVITYFGLLILATP